MCLNLDNVNDMRDSVWSKSDPSFHPLEWEEREHEAALDASLEGCSPPSMEQGGGADKGWIDNSE